MPNKELPRFGHIVVIHVFTYFPRGILQTHRLLPEDPGLLSVCQSFLNLYLILIEKIEIE